MQHRADGINRRTVLKGIGAGAAVGLVGPSAFTGRAAAANGDGDFYLYAITPSSDVYGALDDPDVTQYLIRIDPTDASTEVVTEIDFDGALQTPTIAFHPDGTLYGVRLDKTASPKVGQVYSIDPSTGDVTLIGSTDQLLFNMYGSAFVSDGTYKGINTTTNAFYSPIDYTESGGATDSPGYVGGLVDKATGDPIDANHTGLAVNFATDAIYTTLGNQEGGSRDEVGIVDQATGEVDIIANDVFAAEQLVGAELAPCTGILYVVRNGDQLKSYDLATGDERDVGTLTINGGERVVIDNLAAKWVDCSAGCTRTIGYYKTHGCDPKGNNDNVVQPLLDPGIWLGREDPQNPGEPLGMSVYVTESCAENEEMDGWSAEELLDTSGKKEPKDMLLAQLLAAKLNIRNGADQSTILETILYVDQWLAGEREADGDTVEMWKDALDAYNNGYFGPGHCDDDEEKEEEKEKDKDEDKDKEKDKDEDKDKEKDDEKNDR